MLGVWGAYTNRAVADPACLITKRKSLHSSLPLVVAKYGLITVGKVE